MTGTFVGTTKFAARGHEKGAGDPAPLIRLCLVDYAGMSRTILPIPLPSCMRWRAEEVSSSAKVSLIIGRRPCSAKRSSIAPNSSGVPIAVPSTSRCLSAIRIVIAFGVGPAVAPKTTIRPPDLASETRALKFSPPTWSTERSTPPVMLLSPLRAELLRLLDLLVAPRGDEDAGAKGARDLDQKGSHPAADPGHDDGLVLRHPATRYGRPVSGQTGERQRRGLLVRKKRGLR